MTPKKEVSTVKCPQCGKRFKQKRPDQKYDNADCRMAYFLATHPRVAINREETT